MSSDASDPYSFQTEFGCPLKFHAVSSNVSELFDEDDCDREGGDHDMDVDSSDDDENDDWTPPPLLSGRYTSPTPSTSKPSKPLPFLKPTYSIPLHSILRPELLTIHYAEPDSEPDDSSPSSKKQKTISNTELTSLGSDLISKILSHLSSSSVKSERILNDSLESFKSHVVNQLQYFTALPYTLFSNREELTSSDLVEIFSLLITLLKNREIIIVAFERIKELLDVSNTKLANVLAEALKGLNIGRAEFCEIVGEVKDEELKRDIAKLYFGLNS